ncbi:twin-arginine translocase TatA/TatE family subunit [Streptosporangium roseum]|uniref:twin-arginine translocase TatA/TatE family subunit n=1 Tax=Streptosporangium roseum TaxID=2001 RepID=UPI0009DF7B29|nr:twin-arginine translocase TatA/TatE family subunit [Streptosporangium roseum]
MADLGLSELLIILAVFILLFGAKKPPDSPNRLKKPLARLLWIPGFSGPGWAACR